jgi:hypothetical protein
MVAQLWTNGRWRANNMQGGGGLIYPRNQRTDGAAWVAAQRQWRREGHVRDGNFLRTPGLGW